MQSTRVERTRSTQASLVSEALAAHMRDAGAMERLHRVAERHGRLPRDSPLARELVADVIQDMFVGEVTCDLERPLAPQIERHVRRRANHLRKANRPGRRRRGALRPEFIPLDEVPGGALVADLPQDAPDAAEIVPWIRELARDDEAAQQLLALYEHDVVLRRDVLASGMTEWVYRAARDRLAGYAVQATSIASTVEPVGAQPVSAEVALSAIRPPPCYQERRQATSTYVDRTR